MRGSTVHVRQDHIDLSLIARMFDHIAMHSSTCIVVVRVFVVRVHCKSCLFVLQFL